MSQKPNLAAVATTEQPEHRPMRDRLRELNRTMSKAERTLAEPQAKLAELNQKLTAARASGERLAGLQARRREHEISRLLDAPVDEAEVTQLAAEIATATKAFEAGTSEV